MLKKMIIISALLAALVVLLSLWCVDKLARLSGGGSEDGAPAVRPVPRVLKTVSAGTPG